MQIYAKIFHIFQSKMVSIKADSHNKCCLFQIFIFSAQLLNCVTSDFCSTCNCCFPNKLPAENSLKSPHHNGADLILNNNILVQNDDALVPPNPKPLVAEQTPKFYKISTSNNQGLAEKIPFTILQGARPSNVASQAILFPVPVAALIVQPLANNPKCNCPTDSSFITSTSPSMEMPNEMCSNCEQKKNDSNKCEPKCEKSNGEESEADGHIEAEDEKTADEGDGKIDGDCSHEAGTDEINCHGEHEESKEHADAVGSEGTKEMCHDCEKTREKDAYKYSTNGAEEIIESTTFSEHQNQYYHQVQKIPIEVFKKFVAKSTGFEVQPIPLPDSERTVQSKDKMRHEDSFENLKERLKEISNKMDLLKNLSMEMKGYPRQFPMARFFNNERMVGTSERAALQARIFGGNQYQPAEHSSQIKFLNQQQKWNHFTQNQLQQFEPTTPTPPIMTTNQKTILGGTSENNIDKSIVQMTSTTSTTINHQQFLLNAIEEFLRESQKIRDKQVPITNEFATNNTNQQIAKKTTTTNSAAAIEQTPSITLGIQMENTSPISSLIVTHQTYESVTPILNSSSFNAFTSNITNPIIATTTSPISNSTINNTNNILIIMTTENPIIAKMNSSNEIESTLLIKTNDSKNLGEIINAENLQPTPEPFNPQKWFYSTTNTPIDGKIANFQEQTSQMKRTHQYELTKSIEIETTQVTKTIANSTAIATNEQTIQQPIMADQPPFGDYEKQESAEKNEETESYESTIPLEGNMTVRSASIKKQPTNAHSHLINLITSIKTQSDEMGFFEKNGDKHEHPKFLSTRHIKEDEKEELEANSSANIESYHYFILMLCLIIFIYFP